MSESKTIILTQRFTEACSYMHQLHGKNNRKGTEIPYISHLLAAAVTVLENGSHEDEVIAALLHDAAEDEGGQPVLDEIQKRFGPRVAMIVEHCSDTLEIKKPKRRPRKEAYLARLSQVEDQSVLLVSIADKLHNSLSILRDYRKIGAALWSRFNAEQADILWYYSELLKIYQEKLNDKWPYLVAELKATVDELNASTGTAGA